MRYRIPSVVVFVSLTGSVWASSALPDQHALICASAEEAKNMVRIVDHAARPVKIGEVLLEMRTKRVKCTVVHRTIEFKNIVDTLRLVDDYDIFRVLVNDRPFFSFKRQKGDPA